MNWFLVFFIIFLIYIAVVHWEISVGIVVFGLISYLVWKKLKADRLRREELSRQQQEHKNQQAEYRYSLEALCNTSLSLFEALPGHLIKTEELLDQAEMEFQERAFAPFWDSVEKAATQLGRYDENVRRITDNAEKHKTASQKYEDEAPTFPVSLRSVHGIQAVEPSNDRLSLIVRKAQRDFEFATIYEQRKTNQLLIAGFTNLAQALDGMGQRIAESIDDLSTQVAHMSSSINSMSAAMTEALEGIQTTMKDDLEAVTAHNEKTLKRHDTALKMLDNIQRRRKPVSAGFRDGEY